MSVVNPELLNDERRSEVSRRMDILRGRHSSQPSFPMTPDQYAQSVKLLGDLNEEVEWPTFRKVMAELKCLQDQSYSRKN